MVIAILQSFCDFNFNLQQLRERQRAPAQAIGNRLAVKELHNQEVGACPGRRRRDGRCVDDSERKRYELRAETLLEFGIGGEVSGENLDGDFLGRRNFRPARHSDSCAGGQG